MNSDYLHHTYPAAYRCDCLRDCPCTAVVGTGPAGIGIDVVELGRISRVVDRLSRTGRLGRIYSPDEIAYAQSQARPLEHLAAAYAAKESLAKALGVSLFAWRLRDVEVGHDDTRPVLVTHGAARRATQEATLVVSLTHTEHYASAAVLVTHRGPDTRAVAHHHDTSTLGMCGR